MPCSPLEKFLVTTAFEEMPVHDAVLDLLSPKDLNALSGVSFIIREDVEMYRQRRWNVDDFLRPWFRHSSSEFRPHLARAGAVVTGSQVLRFFNREPPDPTCDLDIITRVGGLLTLAMFLGNLGYVRLRRVKMSRSHEDYPLISSIFSLTSSPGFVDCTSKAGIVEIFDFYNQFDDPDSKYGGTVKVQVIVVFQYPVEHILFGFHSTGVLNFMTHREAVSIFPQLTFGRKTFYVASREPLGPDWKPAWVEKYVGRGYTIDRSSKHPHIPKRVRKVKDEHSWVIPFKDSPNVVRRLRESERDCYYHQHEDWGAITFFLNWRSEGSIDGDQAYRLSIEEEGDPWNCAWPWYITSEGF